jgi:hypothetical protein
MSFRGTGDLLPCSELYQIVSIWIHKLGPAELERGQQGELNTLLGWNTKYKSKRTAGLQR